MRVRLFRETCLVIITEQCEACSIQQLNNVKFVQLFNHWTVWSGFSSKYLHPPPHSGPGGCRINLSKCTKNAAKRGNVTLTIAYHENEINLNESLKKMTFSQKTFLTLSMVTLANRGHKTASRAEPIFWGQTDLTQWGHISPIS